MRGSGHDSTQRGEESVTESALAEPHRGGAIKFDKEWAVVSRRRVGDDRALRPRFPV